LAALACGGERTLPPIVIPEFRETAGSGFCAVISPVRHGGDPLPDFVSATSILPQVTASRRTGAANSSPVNALTKHRSQFRPDPDRAGLSAGYLTDAKRAFDSSQETLRSLWPRTIDRVGRRGGWWKGSTVRQRAEYRLGHHNLVLQLTRLCAAKIESSVPIDLAFSALVNDLDQRDCSRTPS
jgi:hypothetical protein